MQRGRTLQAWNRLPYFSFSTGRRAAVHWRLNDWKKRVPETTSKIERRMKTALDESRLLILGAQVLFGFQFQGAFQELFSDLPRLSQAFHSVALLLLLLAITCLIAPSLHHQLIYRGESRGGAVRNATFFSGVSILPLTLGLGLSVTVVFAQVENRIVGAIAGVVFTVGALALLYGLGFALGLRRKRSSMPEDDKETPLETKIEQMLTEARVVIPGGQALLGFQFVATLMKPFEALPETAKIVHLVALSAVALAVVLLMTPAAVHRLAYQGEDSPTFFRIGSRLVILAAFPLALGIAADVSVVFFKITAASQVSAAAGTTAFLIMVAVWFAYPCWRRYAAGR